MRKEREILKREVGGPQRQLRAEFYSKLIGVSLQNNPFEVRCSSMGSCHLYQVPEGPLGNEEGCCVQEAADTDHLCLPKDSQAPRPPACPRCSGGSGQTALRKHFCLLCLEIGFLPWKNFSLCPEAQDTNCTT